MVQFTRFILTCVPYHYEPSNLYAVPQLKSDMVQMRPQNYKVMFYKHARDIPMSGLHSHGSTQAQETQGMSLSDYVDQRIPIIGADLKLHLGAPGYDHIKICINVSLFFYFCSAFLLSRHFF